MNGFGVHTSMWTMSWDRTGAEAAVAAATHYKMDFIEHWMQHRAMQELRVCSLALNQ